MSIQKLRMAAVALAACIGVVFVGGVALRAQPDEPSAGGPSGGRNTGQLANRADQKAQEETPGRQVDEKARNEIESLRKRIEVLETKLKLQAPEHQKLAVSTPLVKDLVVPRRYNAKILARRHIDVRALATGVVVETPVKEGQSVKKGDLLFQVRPDLYKAKLDAEMADVKLAQLELDNTKKLFEQKMSVVSRQELALYEAKLAKALAKAKLAETEVSFTAFRAPFDGLVGRLQQQEGSAVKEGDVLTTLSDTGMMWVYFNVPEARYLEFAADPEQAKMGMPLTLVLSNGEQYSESGKLVSIESEFDKETGNIPFRASFPNPKGLLRHGQSGQVLISQSLKSAVLIPQQAAFELLGRRYVYVLDQKDVAHRREIVVRNELDGEFVVRGVSGSERIVVGGVREVRDGEKVSGYVSPKPTESK